MNNYNFLDQLILRSPALSFKSYNIEKVNAIIQFPSFQSALYLASPQLYNALENKKFCFELLSAKEQLSVKRYYNRMTFRPTPFGGFSSFSLTGWGSETSLILNDRTKKLHLNLDQEIVLQLAKSLTGNVWNERYRANSSLYKEGKDFRFIKTSHSEQKSKAIFDLEAYQSNSIIQAIITYCNRGECDAGDIIAFIQNITGVAFNDAAEYFNFLTEAQLIIPSTHVNIVGGDYLNRLISMPGIAGSILPKSLDLIMKQLETAVFPGADTLLDIRKQLENLMPYRVRSSLPFFYAGLEKTVSEGKLSTGYQRDIHDGLNALKTLSKSAVSANFQQFIAAFKLKYDRQKVRLLEAIDPEIGIGYGSLTQQQHQSELLQHINFNIQQDKLIHQEWSDAHRLLFNKWTDKTGFTDSLQLKDDDLNAIRSPTDLPSAPSLAVLFRIVNEGLFIEAVSGTSATALIGRFTLWSKEINNLSKTIAHQEQSANQEVIFAEIGQLSDSHTDNINRRQHSYDYEIMVNAYSTLPVENQIRLSDLWVSVVNDKVILESEVLQKVIVPRLSSAYNYTRNELAVFRILCDLQHQGLHANYLFELAQYFPGLAYYPRVVFKNTILSAATWHLSVVDLKLIGSSSDEDGIIYFQDIQQKRHIPAVIALSRSDQQLVFNTVEKEEVRFLIQCLRTMETAVMQEYFSPKNSLLLNQEGLPIVNQFVGVLYSEDTVYTGTQNVKPVQSINMQQTYIIGSKWLYLKLYCNPDFSNELLTKRILPFLQKQAGKLQSWFFIRFRDSAYHIRLRLRLPEELIGEVLLQLKKQLSGAVQYHLIRDYQADTYRREMERYGPDLIQLVEEFFHASSELVMHYIKASRLKSFKYPYHSLGFKSVSQLLNMFLPDLNDQLVFLQQMVNVFYAEFAQDKALKVDLDLKNRAIKAEVQQLLASTDYFEKLNLVQQMKQFRQTATSILKALSGSSPKRKNQILADLVHMHLNRIFIDRQRHQELIIYYCLYKYKLSMKAIAAKR
ncbi:lantibiotic dehydratase [Mucilaginibacter sp. E4BP6]|uniref:lantibiotic dehydratase n=1 Tax=Mucilaginibacter sp. E4BP6 TaxID=2723089 RepID=UPI0015CEF2DA|nr:lantibiotic dehydratase [Mucilaginibacter sp. E4BP6]NYE66972.1 thiopeptide-type bacteriocin biosynthesis protein [Mucilaginibacter sp. E4BP6]